jgi:hypothetical protein
MRIKYDGSDGRVVDIEQGDYKTLWEAFTLFYDVLAGAGFIVPFTCDAMLDALTVCEDWTDKEFGELPADPKLGDGGADYD